MIDIGVQTKGILPEKSVEEGFAQIRKAGFTRIDFNLDTFLKNSDLYAGQLNTFFDKSIDEITEYFKVYKRNMDKMDIRASQMHAPYPVRVEGRNEQNIYMQTEVIPKSIRIAEILKVPYMVIHPFKMQYLYGRNCEKQENIEYFKKLIPLAKQCNIRICLENLYESIGGRIVEGVCADPEDAVWYVDTLNSFAGEEVFGFCLDTGHLQLVKRNPYEYIKRLGSRLKILHLHENDGIGDLHQMPFSFGKTAESGLDWNGIIRGLREIHFDGTLSFETFPCVNSFPKGMTDSVLETIYAVGEYLKETIEK